ncbi:efflux RND transporter permease subunit [Rickettsiales bacterium LUAb2]
MSKKEKLGFFSDPLTWMVHHSVSANLLMVIFLGVGFFLMVAIKKEVFPTFDRDRIDVAVSYQGVSVDNMEEAIAVPIENAIADVDGIGDIKSTIVDGSTTVDIEILDSNNLNSIYGQIQSKVNGISTFPDDMPNPTVVVNKPETTLVYLMLSGNVDQNSLKEAMNLTRNVFAQNPDAGSLVISGDEDYEIRVEVPQDNLRKYNLTLEDIGKAIANAGMDLSTGTIKNTKEKVDLRFNYKKYNAREFENVVILRGKNGSTLYLKDIAKISDDFEDTDYDVSNNNQPAIFFYMNEKEGQTPQSVSAAVKQTVAELQTLLPKGINVQILMDSSRTFNQRAYVLVREGLIGMILVVLILSLFLEFRLAFWASWGMPISFMGSFILLYLTRGLTDFSVNIISLFAFIIVLGIVIDDSIVVGENVYSHKENDKTGDSKQATANGVKEVASSVFFSIFTNIVSFMPLAFLPGTMGKLFRQIPIVIIFVLLISLFESLFVLPARISFPVKHHNGTSRNPLLWFKIRFNRIFDIVVGYYYLKLLRQVIRYRYFVLSLIVGVMIIFFGFLSSGRMGFILMPDAEGDFVALTATFPYTSTLETKIAMREKLVNKAKEVGNNLGGPEEFKAVEADILGNELNVRIFLQQDKRPYSAFVVLDKWKQAVGNLIGLDSYSFTASMATPGGDANLSLELSSPDPVMLAKATNELVAKLKKYPYVTHVETDAQSAKKEFRFTLNQYGEALGLTPNSVATQVKNAVYGYQAIQQVKGHNTLKVMVKLPKSEISSKNDVNNIVVNDPNGNQIPLNDVVDYKTNDTPPTINRLNYERNIEVSGYVDPDSKSAEILSKFLDTDFKAAELKYPGLQYHPGGRQKEMAKVGKALVIGFIVTLFTIYTALAMFFNSYIQPVIIMVAIPFGFVGAIIGHVVMGFPLSIPSMFGLLALSGVVVNASMILIYFSNQKQELYDMTAKSAIMHVSKKRFRPILLTALTAFAGMLPTIISSSSEVAFLRPIAVALGFGVIFSTIITLICMPVFYMLIDDIKSYFTKKPSTENIENH